MVSTVPPFLVDKILGYLLMAYPNKKFTDQNSKSFLS